MMMSTVVLEDDGKQNGAIFFSTVLVRCTVTEPTISSNPLIPATSNTLGEARLRPSHVHPGIDVVDAEARAGVRANSKVSIRAGAGGGGGRGPFLPDGHPASDPRTASLEPW